MSTVHKLICIVTTLFLVVHTNFALENGAQYVLPAGQRECFYRDIIEGAKIDFDAQVLNGGDLDVTIQIISPSGKLLVDEQKTTDLDRDVAVTENGTYAFCFDNSFSIMTEKVVYFDLGIEDGQDPNNDVYANLKEKDTLDETQPEFSTVVKSLKGLHKRLEEIILFQAVHRAKEARHRKTAEGNFTRVTWFSLTTCIVMVIVGILQVVIVRNLFSEKRAVRA